MDRGEGGGGERGGERGGGRAGRGGRGGREGRERGTGKREEAHDGILVIGWEI